MNVYDYAHHLSKELKESNEYKEYKRLEIKLREDVKNKEMILDFKRRQFELEKAQLMGDTPDEQKISQLQELYKVLMTNPLISDFFHAEFRLNQLMADIYNIIGESIKIDMGELNK